MSDILIRPQELRQTAEQLQAYAKKIDAALQAIDNDMLSLKRDNFLGNRANAVQAHYAPKREALLKAKEIVSHFAEDLRNTATRFEQADSKKENALFVQDPFDKSDIDINDVDQGLLGDCYLIASIAAIAQQRPDLIRQMIRDNGDGTYTVTLYIKNKFLGFERTGFTKNEYTITIDGSEYARLGDEIGMEQEVWVQIIEKAYAQMHGTYQDIEGGLPHNALEILTGIDSRDYSPASVSIQDLASHLEKGEAVTVSSLHDYKLGNIDIPDASDSAPLYQNNTLFTNHAYTVTSVDVVNGTVTVRNPWGFNYESPENPSGDAYVTLTFSEFQTNFSGVTINPLH
ncbi:MAG: WXG100 family type VII secretion target [Anaerolineales bacterium]|nr:WXG100 family type VII secretion target [Anaerolineales bacterium]